MYNADDISRARNVDLYDFLAFRMPDQVKVRRNYLTLIANPSVSVKRGQSVYRDFGSPHDPHGRGWGNGIDLLVYYLGYSEREAISFLAGSSVKQTSPKDHKSNPKTPFDKNNLSWPVQGKDNKRVFAYLTKTRMIPEEIVNNLIKQGLIYQDNRGNCVFAARDRIYGEVKSTVTNMTGNPNYRPIRYTVPNSASNGAWYFHSSATTTMTKIFICEAAVDAMSLSAIHKMQGVEQSAVYVDIGGAGKQQAIDRFVSICKKKGLEPILAVDNDRAGDECAAKNPNLKRIVPTEGKDWNDMLRIMTLGRSCWSPKKESKRETDKSVREDL